MSQEIYYPFVKVYNILALYTRINNIGLLLSNNFLIQNNFLLDIFKATEYKIDIKKTKLPNYT